MHDPDQDFITELLKDVSEDTGDEDPTDGADSPDAVAPTPDDLEESTALLERLVAATQGDDVYEAGAESPHAAARSTESDQAQTADTSESDTVGAAQDDPISNEQESVARATEQSPDSGRTLSGLWSRLQRSRYKMVLVAIASFALGSFVAYFCMSFSTPPAAPASKPNQEPQRLLANYIAAAEHRGEPIQPIAPIPDLKPAVVELGAWLFHDRGLSGNGRIACATCHMLDRGGTDQRPRSAGSHGQPFQRNVPSVINVALSSMYHWDGRTTNLANLIDNAITGETELGSDWERVIKYLQGSKQYVNRFRKHMGGDPTQDRVIEALAAYLRSLLTFDSPFDRWLRGEELALSTEQLDGYRLFRQFGCINCHHGPNVGGQVIARLGVAQPLDGSRYASLLDDPGRFAVTSHDRDQHAFRAAPLRVALRTAPYFHDGTVATLDEAIRLMCRYQCGVEPNEEQVRRIGLFIESLDGQLPAGSILPEAVLRSFARGTPQSDTPQSSQ